MEGGFGLVDLIVFVLVALFIVTRFFEHKLPKSGKKGKKTARKGGKIIDFQVEFNKVAPKPAKKEVKTEVIDVPTTGIAGIKAADSSFNESEFLKGSSFAFNMYYKAFKAADEDTLDSLLSPKMFDKTLDEIENGNNKVEASLIEKPVIFDARVGGKTLIIDVKYTADLKIGDEKPKKVEMVWTWARPVESDDPNWELDNIALAS